jgi:hypothetical protein
MPNTSLFLFFLCHTNSDKLLHVHFGLEVWGEDPKELKDGAYCAHTYVDRQRVNTYDIFVGDSDRISWPKTSVYMAQRLPEVTEFIQRHTSSVLEALFELNTFMLYFNIPTFPAKCSAGLPHILATMRSERGATWAQQLRWFLQQEDASRAPAIGRSFAARWEVSLCPELHATPGDEAWTFECLDPDAFHMLMLVDDVDQNPFAVGGVGEEGLGV